MTKKAGKAVTAALAEDIERMLAAEPDVRADAYDSVHQMRVATRRLRSVLRSYRTLFRKSEIEQLSAELKWLAGLLGVARDAEVRAERFAALSDTGDKGAATAGGTGSTPDSGKGAADPHDGRMAVVDHLVEVQRAVYSDAHTEVLTALDSERYAELRETLEHWRTDPPLRGKRGRAPAAKVFRAVLDRDTQRLRTRISTEPDLPEDDRVEALHDIRKAAKRLRYSAEAAVPVLGDDAADLSARAKKVQSVLGDHRDAVEAAQVILAAASQAEADHTATVADTDLYLRLAAAEEAAATRELERYPEAARAFTADSHSGRSAD